MIEDDYDLVNCPQGYEAPQFYWDRKRCAKQLELDDECLRCMTKSGSGFKTVLGTQRFQQGGKYYFEIFINKGSLLKIGVARPDYDTFNEAFSDTSSGWAIYNGETRHNSNSSGQIYGSKMKAGDIIGVAVDMEIGTLSFSRNGQCWGIAFKDQELRKGQLVAAISPITINDVFTLRNLVKQD